MTNEEWYNTEVRPLREKLHDAIGKVLTEVQPEPSATLAAMMFETTALIGSAYGKDTAEQFEAHFAQFFNPPQGIH